MSARLGVTMSLELKPPQARRRSRSKGPFKWEGGTTATYVANVPSQGGRATSPPPPPALAPDVPTSGGGGGPTSAPNVPTSGGNVQRQRGQSTSLDTDAHAPHSASELAPAAGWAALGTAPGGVNSRTEQ
jgi:hypothetical protein